MDTGFGLSGSEQVKKSSWITLNHIPNRSFANILEGFLDYGESEVIALGQEIKADLLLLDEKSARNAAFRLNYPVLGTVGILIWAKRMQVISSLRQELDSLQQKGGLRLSQKVYNYAISKVYE